MSVQSSTITSKGQVTIPKSVRDSLHLLSGDKVEFLRNDADEIVIKPITKRASDLAGILKQYAKKEPVGIEEMNQAVADGIKKKFSK